MPCRDGNTGRERFVALFTKGNQRAGSSSGRSFASSAHSSKPTTQQHSGGNATPPTNHITNGIQLSLGVAAFLAADSSLKAACKHFEVTFPSPLVGMFGIFTGLATLSAVGAEPASAAIVAACKPALSWIQRYLPLFFVPALVVLPIAAQAIAPEDLAKVAGIVLVGMPFSLYVTAGLVAGIRAVTNVSVLPVPTVPPLPPFTAMHGAVTLGFTLAGLACAMANDAQLSNVADSLRSSLGMLGISATPDSVRHIGKSLFLLGTTVGGLLVGSGVCPSALRRILPHPVLVTALAANAGCAFLGAMTGDGYWPTLSSYLTKGKDGAPLGPGDVLMGFLGCVVLSFGFHIYGQRALLFRHAAEVLGCAAGSALISLLATCAAGRAVGLPPDVSLAIAPRAVTVALAMPIAEQIGAPVDLIPVCATAVVLTGLLGAASVQRLLDLGRIVDPVTRGLSTAGSCHGLGTAALAAKEPNALPFCALAYGLIGVAASCWAAVPQVQAALQMLAGKEAPASTTSR